MKKLKILAVDDNVVNLQTLVQTLQSRYEVIPMNSGMRAIRYLKREKADLILLDVQMPDMDGIETLKEIRERNDGMTIPVIFLTSSNDRATVIEGMKLGIMDFIVKPFQPEELIERIERTLRRQGVIPVETKELLQYVSQLDEQIRRGQYKEAAVLAKEISGYRIPDEVAGRIRTIAGKLDAGDTQAAEQASERVVRLLQTQRNMDKKQVRTLSRIDWTVKLHHVLDELDAFRTQEAIDRMNEILSYGMSADQRHDCEEVLTYLRNYDDAEAEKLLIRMLDSAIKPA
jgi:DNA-binding response OmpR family regulator